MKVIFRSAAAAAGLSFLLFLGSIEPLASHEHSWIYHDSGAPASVILALLVNGIVIWLLLTTLFLFAAARAKVFLWFGIIVFTPWLLLRGIVQILVGYFSHRLSVALFLLSGLCWIATMAFWRPGFLPLFERVQRFASYGFASVALFALVVLGQVSWNFWDARSLQAHHPLHQSMYEAATDAYAEKPRIIWIILDELSYQQVYEHRYPSLELPAFDKLASESTVFTHVLPAANYTDIAVPSMMAGLPADHVRLGDDGALMSLHSPASGRWQPFQARDTVFQDALNHGFSTAVAGWYNPYCRILPEVLDHCEWSNREVLGEGMRSDAPLLTNIAAPWVNNVGRIAKLRLGNGEMLALAAEDHISDYAEINAAGDRFLEDRSVDFLLLHMPVPHPGGIYDRRTKTFTNHQASYIDNLALADRYLAHVREVLEERGEWDSSAVVVMGDHSWRTTLVWLGTPQWTAEDEAASHGGQFDDRPGYIVKLPGQMEGARIETSFAAVRTRALLDGIMDGSIRSEAELAAFAGSDPTPAARPEVVATRAGGGGLRSRGR